MKRLISLVTVLTACSLALLAARCNPSDFMAQIANYMGVNDAHPHGVPSSFGFTLAPLSTRAIILLRRSHPLLLIGERFISLRPAIGP